MFNDLTANYKDKIEKRHLSVHWSYRTAQCMFTKLGRDEVLMVPNKCCCFCQIRPGDPGWGKNRSRGSPSSTNFFFRPEGYSNKPNA